MFKTKKSKVIINHKTFKYNVKGNYNRKTKFYNILLFHAKRPVKYFTRNKIYRKVVIQHIQKYTNVQGNYSKGSVIGKGHSKIFSCPSYGGGELKA